MPACFARRIRSEYTAGIVPLPRSPIPMASVRQFMEFAVYIPEQEPQVGHTFSSNSASSSIVMVPAATLPTASNIEDKLLFCPCTCPANMGPPDTKIVGIFTLAAAIKSPGTFLSQLGIHTRPSNPCAIAIHSVLSAIRSLVTREYFIPTCPMAIPSHTAMAGNTTGIPPAMATPIFTASVILSRFMCPGTISLKELTIPIMGRLLSSSVNPRALNRLLWGAWAVPVFTESLLISLSLFLFSIRKCNRLIVVRFFLPEGYPSRYSLPVYSPQT